MLTEIVLIAGLILVNGVLAMSELAVVSARPIRLKIMAEQQVRGAEKALKLNQESGRFLSTVQIGITLVGILNGAVSGATVGHRLADWLVTMGFDVGSASTFGVGIVVVVVTYLSLIVGEIVPKQLALRHPERIAAFVAPGLHLLSMLTIPVVWLLDASAKLVMMMFGQSRELRDPITEEEVRSLITEAEQEGILEAEERSMISSVMRFADRGAQALMTARRDVEILDLGNDIAAIKAQCFETVHSRMPVQDGGADDIIGVILVREVLKRLGDAEPIDLRAEVLDAPVVLDQVDALSVLRAIRSSIVHMALVYDEYGHFEGIVTAGDVLEAIAGEFREEGGEGPSMTQRPDGSFFVEGWMPVDEFAERLGVTLPAGREFLTVAGLVLSQSGHLPKEGEKVVYLDLEFEVVDLDGRRIDKLIVKRVPSAEQAENAPAETGRGQSS